METIKKQSLLNELCEVINRVAPSAKDGASPEVDDVTEILAIITAGCIVAIHINRTPLEATVAGQRFDRILNSTGNKMISDHYSKNPRTVQ